MRHSAMAARYGGNRLGQTTLPTRIGSATRLSPSGTATMLDATTITIDSKGFQNG